MQMTIENFRRWLMQSPFEVVGTASADDDPLYRCFGEVVVPHFEPVYPDWAQVFTLYHMEQMDEGQKITGKEALDILDFIEANKDKWDNVLG